MKVFLDDVRETPDGWWRTYTVGQTIQMLEKGGIDEVSLDHDLGELGRGCNTSLGLTRDEDGNDVLLWIENKVYTDPTYIPPLINIHSDNGSGREKMEASMKSIAKRFEYNLQDVAEKMNE